MVSRSRTLPIDEITSEQLKRWSEQLPAPVISAIKQAQSLYQDKKARTGQSLFLHSLHLVDILRQLELDEHLLIAAVLYRTWALELASQKELIQTWGDEVFIRIDTLVKIEKFTPLLATREAKEEQAENLRRMLLAISDDVRVIIIVLAERLHLMRMLDRLNDAQQQLFSRNTRDIFTPIANRLGIWQFKWEMEDLALRYLDHESYKEIARQLEDRRDERLKFIDKTIGQLTEEFSKSHITAVITGRPKHIYSIWRKMRNKEKEFSHIYDVRAIRVLVDSLADCYATLGLIHGLWRHIPKEFDDYIATPKANGYQSIHTVVIGDDERPLEVQIRTHEMHHVNEHGVAAHWRYKEQRGENKDLQRRIQWMRQWLEQQDVELTTDQNHDPDEQANIYVLTPQGRVIELPEGATAIDFAYAIHTSVGHRCRGAKVDGRITPLTQALKNGETVEILTAKQEQPSRDWLISRLGYIKTARARGRIRSWFRHQDHDAHVETGRESLERELVRLSLDKPDLNTVAQQLNLQNEESLLAAIGRGDLSVVQVATWGQKREAKKTRKTPVRRRKKDKSTTPQLIVDGVDSLLSRLGQCCKPVPGDDVIGFITKGQGVTVHRKDCSIIHHLDAEGKKRLIKVHWQDGEQGGGLFKADVQIIAVQTKGIVGDVSSIFYNEDIDIHSMRNNSDSQSNTIAMKFTLELGNSSELNRLLERLRQHPDVIEATRVI